MIEIEQVSNAIWAHTKGKTRGNVACIQLKDGLVMVDSGMDPVTIRKFRGKMENRTNTAFEYLVITHSHPDHVFGNQVFEDCEIISSQGVYDIMEEKKASDWKKEKLLKEVEGPELKEKWTNLRIVLPTKTFQNEYTIQDGKIVRIVETQGHTKGSAYLYIPDEETIIAGDLLFAHSYPYGGDPTADIYAWVQALEELIDLEAKKVVPGHGPVTTRNELKVHREYLQTVIKRMEEAITNGMKKKEIETHEWPDFPYEVDPDRHKSLLKRTYKKAKEKLGK